MESLSDALGGLSVLMGTIWTPAGITDLASARVPESAVANLLTGFATPERNPLAVAAPRSPMAVPLPVTAFLNEAEYLRTPLYNELMRPAGLGLPMHGFVHRGERSVTALNLARIGGSQPFEREEIEFFARVLPHVAQAMRVRRQLDTAAQERRALLEALETLDRAVILLDTQGRIVFTNARADQILAGNDGVCAGRSGLAAVRSDDTRRLRKLIGAAASTAAARGCDGGGMMLLPRPSGKAAYALLVAPLRLDANEPCADAAIAVAVFVNDPEHRPRIPAHLLSGLYQLTSAEARLTVALLSGASLPEAAGLLAITENTAKWHLKAVFAKIGVRRHAELVARVLADVGPLNLDRLQQ